MSLSESISFDRKTLQFSGFVDLGEHTPKNQHNIRGDHALVFMYQPFRGSWVQVLGCFLSKNSVTSKVLHKLILECVLLLEGSGFHVDVVTMDGAQWNRGVWSIFGVKDDNFSCQHPCDADRRLWMMSDFPHLIKCFRNAIIKLLEFWTQKGMVRKEHFQAVLDYEGYTKPNMSVAYTLTPAHINPKGYQKMNVLLAFQLFSERVRVAMELLKDHPNCPALSDAEPTIHLIRLIDNLIHAMMSRTPTEALRLSDECKKKKAIEEFLEYLREWETGARLEGCAFPISPSTVTGLKVTLGSTLELLQFLHDEYNYEYLMTARLNQDALERFFGMMRNACGSNDHPDPVLFTQVFRLLCSYSLVKPPKGSNVSGPDLLQTLMQTKESMASSENPKKGFLDKLDALIEAGHFDEPEGITPARLVERDHPYSDAPSAPSQGPLTMHDYDVVKTSEEVQAYIAGYVARKFTRFSKCIDCTNRLRSADRCERDRMIDLMNRFDGLIYPSEELFKLTKTLEDAVLEVVGTLTVKENTLFQIVDKVGEVKNLTFVGCIEHEKEVTKKVINFYLVMRANFLAESINKNCDAKRVKTKMYRKNAKL